MDKKEVFIYDTRKLSEKLINFHLDSIGSYDILYPFMTLVSLLMYFLSNYMEFYLINSKLSFKTGNSGFEGIMYLLVVIATTFIYFREIRETNVLVPIITILAAYNFILRINNFFPGKKFLSRVKTGLILTFRELQKSIELPAAALSTFLIIISLNQNRMLTLMPIQMLFWFNFINRTI